MKENMKRKSGFKIGLLAILITGIVIVFLFGSFYTCWNSASPEKTCASCHEIGKSVNMFAQSSHRKLSCKECHGTALSNGFHSLKEKGMMVVNHIKNESVEDIRINEEQMLRVMDNCIRCHNAEYAKWISGGHSVKYKDIFLNEKHNTTEQLNFDCLRCHGMFSPTDVTGIVEPISKTGPWKLKNPEISDIPAIPCLACHQIHNKGISKTSPDYSVPRKIFYQRQPSLSKVSFYNRADRSNIPVDNLPELQVWNGNIQLKVSDDPVMRNCVQCHAPGASHQAGTSDDRTPRGVHEGISCNVCHEPHSNESGQSCIKCHPAISNCKLDVTKMNTSFADPESKNNIHWVSCVDCHKDGIPKRKIMR
jgi:hypothetical protein